MATIAKNRNYKGADWYLLEHSQTLLDQFTQDQADFEAYDPAFADPFAEDWQTAIEAAVNYQDDTAIQADIALQSEAVKQQMQLCLLKYDDVIYFAQKAFGKNAVQLKAFGKGTTYRAASRSQGKMRNFMDELHQAAEKHKTALIAAGFTQLKIDEIVTLRNSFTTANSTQNTSKTDRPEISQGRLNTYNTLYNNFTLTAITAAQLVYRTNPAKLGQYTYNPPINHRPAHRLVIEAKAGAVIDLKQQAANIQPPLPEPLELQPIEKVRFTATGSSFTIYLTETPDSPPTGKQLQIQPGKMHNTTIQKLAQQLGVTDNMKYAYAQNTGLQKGTLTITYYPNEE